MDVITEISLGQSVVSVRQLCSMLGVVFLARLTMALYAVFRPGLALLSLLLTGLWHCAFVTPQLLLLFALCLRLVRELLLLRLLDWELSVLHSQLLPDRSWSSSQGWDEVPEAMPELAETLSCWSAQPPPSPDSCPADPSSKYTQAAPCNENSFNQEQQQPGVADMER